MANVDYSDIRADVAAAMAEASQGEIKIGVATPGGGPAHNPGEPTIAYTTLIGTGSGVTKQYREEALEVGADLVVRTAVVTSLTPNLTDHLMVDGVRREIKRFKPIPAIGTAVLWVFFCAGAGVDEEA